MVMGSKGTWRDFFNRSTGSSRQTDDVHMGTFTWGNTLRTHMLGMHAARRNLEALSCPERYRVVVTGDGNFTAEDKRFGVEVMAMIGRDQVRLHAAVHNPIAVTTQFRFELKTIH